MCSGLICGVSTVAVGAVLVFASSFVGYYVVPNVVENSIISGVVLENGTEQMERFEEVPFALTFNVYLFNISNQAEVLAGAVPALAQRGPYVYKLYQSRQIESLDEDLVRYRPLMHTEFDSEASFPLSDQDVVHVANVAYHGVLQVTEGLNVPALMPVLDMALDGVFGDNNGPIIAARVADLLFDGVTLCKSPGIASGAACTLIRQMVGNIQNMEVQPDNTIKFSVFGYREGVPGSLHEAYRGIHNHQDLGRIIALNSQPALPFWAEEEKNSTQRQSVCNMINGTDSGIFAPFIEKTKPLFALNTDICRSVELRYQNDVEFKGIPAARFSANEWFLDNDDGCFCINVTAGVTREGGCLLQGAMELFSCVGKCVWYVIYHIITITGLLWNLQQGAYMVLTYPHFLYADLTYRNGVIGLHPVEEDHRIFLDIEPLTGTVIRGFKRAQFNVFMRAIPGIPATQHLRTTLTPVLWIEEGIALPDEYADLLSSQVVSSLGLVNILVPVVVALSCTVLLTGITIIVCLRFKKKTTV